MLTTNSFKDKGTTGDTEVTSTHHRCQTVFGTCCCVGWLWAVCSTVTWRTCHTLEGCVNGITTRLLHCLLYASAMLHLNRLWFLKWPHSGADVYWKHGVWEGEPNSFLDRKKIVLHSMAAIVSVHGSTSPRPSDEFDCNILQDVCNLWTLLIKFGTIFNPCSFPSPGHRSTCLWRRLPQGCLGTAVHLPSDCRIGISLSFLWSGALW